jgi:hypothetical protein
MTLSNDIYIYNECLDIPASLLLKPQWMEDLFCDVTSDNKKSKCLFKFENNLQKCFVDNIGNILLDFTIHPSSTSSLFCHIWNDVSKEWTLILNEYIGQNAIHIEKNIVLSNIKEFIECDYLFIYVYLEEQYNTFDIDNFKLCFIDPSFTPICDDHDIRLQTKSSIQPLQNLSLSKKRDIVNNSINILGTGENNPLYLGDVNEGTEWIKHDGSERWIFQNGKWCIINNNRIIQCTFVGTSCGWQPLLGLDFASNIVGFIPFLQSRLIGFTLEKGQNGIFDNGYLYIIKYNKQTIIKPVNELDSSGCIARISIKNVTKSTAPLYFSILPNETNIKINSNDNNNGYITWETGIAGNKIERGESIAIYATQQCNYENYYENYNENYNEKHDEKHDENHNENHNESFYSLYGCTFTLYLCC